MTGQAGMGYTTEISDNMKQLIEEQTLENIEGGIAQVLSMVRGRIPHQDQEDILQDIRLALIMALPRFKGTSTLKTYVYSIVNRKIADYYRDKYKQAKTLKKLMEMARKGIEIETNARTKEITPRQKEVLILVGKGCENKEIAKELCLSIHTVESYLKAIRQILGGLNRSRLAILANKLYGGKE